MCSSGDSTAKNLEQSQAAMTSTLNQDYSTAFSEQQQVLANLNAKLNYIAANPMGMTPQQTATATTAINENTAQAARQAIGSAAAYAATHGGADVGSGPTGEIAGQIASGAAQSKAIQLGQLSNQNELLKQQNFWNAIQGMSNVGSQYGSASGTAIGGGTSTANSSVSAGDLALKSQQAGWQNIGGIISGIGGLASAGVGAYTAFDKAQNS